jgi:hypothetical protein
MSLKQKFLTFKILGIPSQGAVIDLGVVNPSLFKDLEVGQKYEVEVIELDKEEYEKLEDFKGF